MENFQPLTDFYEAIADDARIGATHISLYMALLQEWNIAVAQNPLSVNRDTMMKAARMGRKTYNKCMKELQEYGVDSVIVGKALYEGVFTLGEALDAADE